MPDPASYLVAYEATARGADALQLGAALAGLTGAELRLCLVLPTSSAVPAKVPANAGEFAEVLTAQGESWLATARGQLPPDLSVHTEIVWAESTSEGLIESATGHDVDRVVVGASRHGLLQRFSIGSVANALLHASPVPVALAPRGYRAPARISRITCAVGTRPGWEALLDSMIEISAGLAVDLRFVTLVEVDGAHGSRSDPADGATVDLDPGTAHLTQVLGYVADRSSARGAVTTEVGRGSSVEEAVEQLDWRPDEIAFVGSSRLAGPSRVFLGVTAHRMLHALPVPLVVVPVAP